MSQEVTLYHNTHCSNSRGALALLEARGIPCRVVEYLKTPLGATELQSLMSALETPPHAMVRSKEPAYQEAGLSRESTPAELVAAMVRYPVLMQRPIVQQGTRALIARPPETLMDWLALQRP